MQTNIVIYEVDDRLGTAEAFAQKLRERGVWMFATGLRTLRAVTHLDVSRAQIDQAVSVFRELCAPARITTTAASAS